MTERLLRKELAFLDARWAKLKTELHTAQAGRTTFIVNSWHTDAFAFWMYLEKRRKVALERLRALGATP